MWARVLEAWLTERLLRSPTFHQAVRTVHKRIRQVRHGKDPEELGGITRDEPQDKSVFGHFVEELKDQFKDVTRRK